MGSGFLKQAKPGSFKSICLPKLRRQGCSRAPSAVSVLRNVRRSACWCHVTILCAPSVYRTWTHAQCVVVRFRRLSRPKCLRRRRKLKLGTSVRSLATTVRNLSQMKLKPFHRHNLRKNPKTSFSRRGPVRLWTFSTSDDQSMEEEDWPGLKEAIAASLVMCGEKRPRSPTPV